MKAHPSPTLLLHLSKSSLTISGTRQLHAVLITSSSAANPSIIIQTLRSYAAHDDFLSARQLFDKIPDKKVIFWNSMIRGYAKRHDFSDAFSLFNWMKISGAKPDNYTYACLLRACLDDSNPNGVKILHVPVLCSGLCSDLITGSALMNSYSRLGLVIDARTVFDGMLHRDLVLWNVMISGFGYGGYWREGVKFFNLMRHSGQIHDAYTLVGLMSCFSDSTLLPIACGVHGICLKGGHDCVEHVCSSLVRMYTRCNCLESGYGVFRKISTPDLVTWSALISGFSQSGKCKEALDLFKETICSGKKPDAILLASVLSACALMAAARPCKELHGYIFRTEMCSNISVSCALIGAYTKCGFVEAGFSVFNLMPTKNVVTYNSLISCLGSHGLGKRALDLFEEMLQEGFRPDQATFSAVLCACCHSGLLKEGWTLFRRMKEDYSIVAQVEHYLYMVKLLANDGQLKEAYDLIQTIPICPDPGVLGAFLWGCSYNGYSDLGEAIAHRLFKLDPGKTAYRVILSNMYAAAKKWGDAILMRDDILRKGLQKTPGFSWI